MGKKLDKAKRFAVSAAKTAGKATRKAARATGKTAAKAARATGHAANVSGEILAAAILGNDAEKALSLAAHDVIRDAQFAGEEAMTQGGDRLGPSPREDCSIPDADVIRLFRATATAVWKLKSRMIDVETGEPKDVFSKVWRHVETIGDALSEIGVETIDWTNKHYDEGMSLKVIAEEENEGVKSATITETLLPTIRFRDEKRGLLAEIQKGEVVVSRPAADN